MVSSMSAAFLPAGCGARASQGVEAGRRDGTIKPQNPRKREWVQGLQAGSAKGRLVALGAG